MGPQTAAAMAGLKKALATPDAIVSVNGPVGVGKTTIVRRALEAIGKDQVIVTVGRMQLGHDEVLELLLEELGIEIVPLSIRFGDEELIDRDELSVGSDCGYGSRSRRWGRASCSDISNTASALRAMNSTPSSKADRPRCCIG